MPLPGAQRARQQARAGHAHHVGRRLPASSSRAAAASASGTMAPIAAIVTAGGRRDGAAGSRPPRPAAAAFARRRIGGHRGQRLVHRAGGQPQVGRAAVRPAELRQAREQHPLHVLRERRLVADAARLLEADGRGDDRLVGAALRGEASRRTACRPGSTGRRRRCRTTRAPAPAPRTGRRARRSAAAAVPTGSRWRRARRAARPGWSRRCRARCAARRASRASAGSSPRRRRTSRAGRPRDQTPTLFTQPPRFVMEATSGLTVTTRRAASGAARVRSSRARPSAACVVAVPDGVRPRSAGHGGRLGRRRRRAAQPPRDVARTAPARLAVANRAHGSAGSAPSSRGELASSAPRSAAPSGSAGGPRWAARTP